MIYVSPITYDVNVPNMLLGARLARRHCHSRRAFRATNLPLILPAFQSTPTPL
jgi:hypothetical protein